MAKKTRYYPDSDDNNYQDNSFVSPYSGESQKLADNRAFEKYKEFLKKQGRKDKAFRKQFNLEALFHAQTTNP